MVPNVARNRWGDLEKGACAARDRNCRFRSYEPINTFIRITTATYINTTNPPTTYVYRAACPGTSRATCGAKTDRGSDRFLGRVIEGACAVLLVIGLRITSYAPNLGWSIHWRGAGYGISPQMFFFGLATVFCALATLYSVAQIPFNRVIVQWHFWLSMICVFSYILCQLLVYTATRGGVAPKTPILALASLSAVLVPVFFIAQVSITLEVVRALMRIRSR